MSLEEIKRAIDNLAQSEKLLIVEDIWNQIAKDLGIKVVDNIKYLDFNPDLLIKPILICRTKADIECDLSDEWGKFINKVNVISSVSGEGLDSIISKLSKKIR